MLTAEAMASEVVHKERPQRVGLVKCGHESKGLCRRPQLVLFFIPVCLADSFNMFIYIYIIIYCMYYQVQILNELSPCTMDFRQDRVRIFINKEGKVAGPPRTG